MIPLKDVDGGMDANELLLNGERSIVPSSWPPPHAGDGGGGPAAGAPSIMGVNCGITLERDDEAAGVFRLLLLLLLLPSSVLFRAAAKSNEEALLLLFLLVLLLLLVALNVRGGIFPVFRLLFLCKKKRKRFAELHQTMLLWGSKRFLKK